MEQLLNAVKRTRQTLKRMPQAGPRGQNGRPFWGKEAERERLDDVLAATAAGVWEWNVQTHQVRVSERWAGQLGRTVASLGELTVQNTWMALSHPDDLKVCLGALEAHFDGSSALYEAEFRMRHTSGAWIWILARGSLKSRLPDGSPGWMLGTHVDISGVKRQEEQLRRTQTLLARIGEIAAIGSFEVCLASGQLELSSNVKKLLGLAPDIRPGVRKTLHLLDAHERHRLCQAVAQARRAGGSWQLDVTLVPGSGGSKTFQVTGQEEAFDGRKRMVGAVQDTTACTHQRRQLESTLRRLQAANLAGGVGSWSHDFRRGDTYCDPLLLGMLDIDAAAAQPISEQAAARVHPDDRARLLSAFHVALRSARVHEDEWRVNLTGGQTRVLHGAAIIERGEDGRAMSVTGAIWDVTQPRLLEQEFAQHRALLQVTLNSISDAILATDGSGAVQWMNAAATRLLCTASAQAFELPGRLADDIRRCIATAETVSCAETLNLGDAGQPVKAEYVCSPMLPGSKSAAGAVVVVRDVTEQQQRSEAMLWQATHDSLTGLANRAAFDSRLRVALARAKAGKSGHALLYLDLDQFKLVNDACGHLVGDQLLKEVAGMVMESVRAADTAARLGGDEFAVILEGCTTEQASRAAQGICERLENYRFEWGGRRFRVGASIGIVPIDERWQDAAEILKAADSACYAAKEAGRNRVRTWLETDESLRERSGEMQWAAALEQALDDDRLELYAQRIASLDGSDARLHVELLVRMRTSHGQIVLPGAFMPAAERYDLAPRIDRRVIQQALTMLKRVGNLHGIGLVCINLSGKSVSDPLFRTMITELLSEVPVELRQRLCMEITETSAVTSLSNARALINALSTLHVSVALDDFGAGASSFGYLRELSVDWLKIDGQYVRDLLSDQLDMVAVKCFIEVARVTGVRTVAEFVESQDVLDELRRLGVNCAQGYLVHRPEPLGKVLDDWMHVAMPGSMT